MARPLRRIVVSLVPQSSVGVSRPTHLSLRFAATIRTEIHLAGVFFVGNPKFSLDILITICQSRPLGGLWQRPLAPMSSRLCLRQVRFQIIPRQTQRLPKSVFSVRERGDLNGALDRKASAVQFDSLDLMERLGRHVALTAVRAVNNGNLLNEQEIFPPAVRSGDFPNPCPFLAAVIACHMFTLA